MTTRSGMSRPVRDDGFSLIELLIVIVVLGVLGGIVVFGVGAFRGDSAEAADQANLKQLNVASTAYRAMAASGEEFDDMASDAARMEALFDRGLLNDDGSGSRVVSPQTEGAVFAWDPTTQAWILALGAPDVYDFTAAGTSPSDFRTYKSWVKSGTDGFTSNYGLLFVPNARPEYTASYTATLAEGTSGGNALLLNSALTADNRDTGYAIQFDRNYNNGAIVVKSRTAVESIDSTAITEAVVDTSTLVFHSGNTNGAIPNQRTDAGKAWWVAPHVISAKVTAVDATTRKVEYSIDGNVVFDNFTFTAPADPAASFVGLRAWGVKSAFGGLTVS